MPNFQTPMRQLFAAAVLAMFASAMFAPVAIAGNGANFVTYDHHTEEKGETEINVFTDFGRASEGGRYAAQLLEIEHALTDQWTVAAYLESHKNTGEDYSFDGFRLETRYRLFDYGTPFNPVVYVEYSNKKESARYLSEATGRTDEAEEPGGTLDESKRENEIETKLILGHDLSERLRLGFDWISEVNLASGDWAFGYASGVTYTAFDHEGAKNTNSGGWSVTELQLGAELFGGAGDSVKGLTLDPGKTEHYAGISVKTEFANGANFMLGGAFGLTASSRDSLFRAALGWEFE